MMPRFPLIEASGCLSPSSRTALEAIPTFGKDGWISCNDSAALAAIVLFISVCLLVFLRLPVPVEQGTAEPSPYHCHGRRDWVSKRLYGAALRFCLFSPTKVAYYTALKMTKCSR